MLVQKNTLFAIPGWGFQANIFDAFMHNEFHCIGLDYLHVAPYSLEAIAQHLAKQLPDQSTIIGWSFGGLIAIQLLALFPHKIKKLILMNSQPSLKAHANWTGITQDNACAFEAALINNFDQHMHHFIRLIAWPHRSAILKQTLKQYVMLNQKETLSALFPILMNTDLRDHYRKCSEDILHLVTTDDAILPQCTKQLKALNPKAQVMQLGRLGHAGFLTHPVIYLNAIRDFVHDE